MDSHSSAPSASDAARSVVRLVRRGGAMGMTLVRQRRLIAAAVTAMLLGAWMAGFAAGDAHGALTGLFYLPVLVAAVPYGLRGAVGTATVAALLAGPLLPGTVTVGDWLPHAGLLLAVGTLAGVGVSVLHGQFERALTTFLDRELAVVSSDPVGADQDLADAHRVRRVLADRAFHPVFQPIYRLHDGRLMAVETLTRFDTEPPRPPDRWFARAHRAGLGCELELAVIERGLEECGRQIPRQVPVSVNVSGATLADPKLGELVRASSRPLIIELTEHTAVDSYAALQDAFGNLGRSDASLAVDDVGTGFASLQHLISLQPSYIKLDLSLTGELLTSPARRAMAESLVRFAQQTDSTLIAEGIEQREDLATWQALGADAAQGYLLGGPGALPVGDRSAVLAGARTA